MQYPSTFEHLRKILVEQLGVDECEVTPEAHFNDDLAGDSLDEIETIMAIETEFNLDIPDADVEKIKTVGAMVEYLDSRRTDKLAT